MFVPPEWKNPLLKTVEKEYKNKVIQLFYMNIIRIHFYATFHVI